MVKGTKTWITNSDQGNCIALLVKTDPEAQPRHMGMSLFPAEKEPGFAVARKHDKLGYHGIVSGSRCTRSARKSPPSRSIPDRPPGSGFLRVARGCGSCASIVRPTTSCSRSL